MGIKFEKLEENFGHENSKAIEILRKKVSAYEENITYVIKNSIKALRSESNNSQSNFLEFKNKLSCFCDRWEANMARIKFYTKHTNYYKYDSDGNLRLLSPDPPDFEFSRYDFEDAFINWSLKNKKKKVFSF